MPSPNPTVRREYAGGAGPTTLLTGIGSGDTAFTLVANTGWPTGAVGNFTVTIDRGNTNEERVLCSAQSAKVVTAVTRGYDSTTASTHAANATVEVTLSGVEADEWNQHTHATAAVHGATGTIVGTSDTQTLTNKTIDGGSNTVQNVPESAVTGLTTDLAAKIAKSLLTTKGDLPVASGASTIVRLGAGSDGQVLIADSTQTAGVRYATDFGIYGDGSDGVGTFDGTTTVLGMVPSSSTYTLTRDFYLAASSAINNGVTIKTAGYHLFCAGTLTNNGTIDDSGGNGAVPTAGTKATGNILAGGVDGGAGAGTGAGNAGGNASAPSLGGAGGAGATRTSAGGGGGTATAPTAVQGTIRSLPYAIAGRTFANQQIFAGAGGGGGSADTGTSTTGGGGGGGGGMLVVAARLITGTGTIRANGGNGGGTVSLGAGGGGGGGGVVVVVSLSVAGGAVPGQTIQANGGSGGVGATAGSNGSSGTVILLNG